MENMEKIKKDKFFKPLFNCSEKVFCMNQVCPSDSEIKSQVSAEVKKAKKKKKRKKKKRGDQRHRQVLYKLLQRCIFLQLKRNLLQKKYNLPYILIASRPHQQPLLIMIKSLLMKLILNK